MKRKGFTLIELLAVIVILAIIALIATPIVLNIINDARRSTNERSIEMYASAVKNAVAAYQLKEGKAPTTFEELEEYITYEGAEVICDTKELYLDGSIYLASCKVGNTLVEGYTYGTEQGSSSDEGIEASAICTAVTEATVGNVPSGNYELGDEYTCEVSDGTSYTFFILSTEGDNVNLILDGNVGSTGAPVISNPVLWMASGSDISNGPVTAINYLNNATLNWTNIPNLNETYDDEGGNFTNFSLTGKARMPKLSEINNAGCTTSANCPTWISHYLYDGFGDIYYDSGYWTLSSYDSSMSYGVTLHSAVVSTPNSEDVGFGVRPVITLSKSNLK